MLFSFAPFLNLYNNGLSLSWMHLLHGHNVTMGTAMLHHAAQFRQTQSAEGRLCHFCRVQWQHALLCGGGCCHSVSVSLCVWVRVVRIRNVWGVWAQKHVHETMASIPHCTESLHSWQTSVIRFRAVSKKEKRIQNVTDLVSLKRILNWDLNDLRFKDVSLPKKAEGSSSFCNTFDTNYGGDILIPSWHRSGILRNTIRQVKPSTKNSVLYKMEWDWSYATVSSLAIRCGFHQLPR